MTKDEAKLVLDELRDALDTTSDKHRRQRLDRCGLIMCREAERPETVQIITPPEEQQMFDDWCPYKGNPDPRTVWAAAVEAVNGMLLGAERPEISDAEIVDLWSRTPGDDFKHEVIEFARALLEKIK